MSRSFPIALFTPARGAHAQPARRHRVLAGPALALGVGLSTFAPASSASAHDGCQWEYIDTGWETVETYSCSYPDLFRDRDLPLNDGDVDGGRFTGDPGFILDLSAPRWV